MGFFGILKVAPMCKLSHNSEHLLKLSLNTSRANNNDNKMLGEKYE